MIGFARTDTSIMAAWWWSVDRWSLAAIAALMGFGALLTLAASPAVAERIGYDSFHFVKRQMIYLVPAVCAYTWGEFLGYLVGPGTALEHVE